LVFGIVARLQRHAKVPSPLRLHPSERCNIRGVFSKLKCACRYPELAREDRQGFSIAYELVERAKRKIQDQEVWYRWLRALVDTNNAMSGQVHHLSLATMLLISRELRPF
jgi:hypothetical protein